jgi:hypothetical protein
MLARPLSVAFVGTLALGAAVLFGMSGCDQLEDIARGIIEETKGAGGAGGTSGGTGNGGSSGGGPVACASSESCPSGQICTTEQGACDAAPGCRNMTSSGTLIACPAVCYGVCQPKDLVPPPKGEACGKNTCAVGEVCCNASCGICTAPGGGCTKQLCSDDPPPPKGEACGKNTCAVGEVCCNASCGICTPPNGGCILLACTDETPPPEQGGACVTGADCHLEADYCGGCNCRALSAKQKVDTCSGALVQCFAEPCLQKTAVCLKGVCTVAAAPSGL